LTNQIYDGLEVSREIRAVDKQGLGDTIVLSDNSKIVAFAVCHVGPKTEAGSGACYAKFAAVRPGNNAHQMFDRLLDACEKFASMRGVERFIAGVNTGRHEAYRRMVGRGFRTDLQGVAMHRENDAGYNRPAVPRQHMLDRSESLRKRATVLVVKWFGALPTGSTGFGNGLKIPPVDLWVTHRWRLTPDRRMRHSNEFDF
jgi:hypothetical protein